MKDCFGLVSNSAQSPGIHLPACALKMKLKELPMAGHNGIMSKTLIHAEYLKSGPNQRPQQSAN